MLKYTEKGDYVKTELRARFLEMKCPDKANVCDFLQGLWIKKEELAKVGYTIDNKNYLSTLISSLPHVLSKILYMHSLLQHICFQLQRQSIPMSWSPFWWKKPIARKCSACVGRAPERERMRHWLQHLNSQKGRMEKVAVVARRMLPVGIVRKGILKTSTRNLQNQRIPRKTHLPKATQVPWTLLNLI